MPTIQSLPFGKTRAQRFIATAAAVAVTASLIGAFQVSSARAAVESNGVSDGRDVGRPDHMRERAPDRRPQQPPIDKHLTNDQVRDIVAGHLAQRGNANLKVGKVTAKDDGVVAVEIVTKTGALVDIRDVSTKTGLPASFEHRFGEMRQNLMAHRGPGMARLGRAGGERGPGEKPRDLALTTDQARKLAEAGLIMRGNPRLKVGAVKEKDADTISVDIVASDNSLVSQQLFDRHSGRPQRPSGERKS